MLFIHVIAFIKMIDIIEKDNIIHHNKFKYTLTSNKVLLPLPKSFATNKKGKKSSVKRKLNTIHFITEQDIFFILRYNSIALFNMKCVNNLLFCFYQTHLRCVQMITQNATCFTSFDVKSYIHITSNLNLT